MMIIIIFIIIIFIIINFKTLLLLKKGQVTEADVDCTALQMVLSCRVPLKD